MPYVETNDHTSLYYRDWGTGSPVVFVSAWALSGAMWEYQMVPLSDQGLRCVASQVIYWTSSVAKPFTGIASAQHSALAMLQIT